ncbi:MAG: hypothetical protein NC485_01830 [Ruminococcus flavefaciens]|nr:hypothetical protein [Ruminococcus flavefaciens]MCM1061904.1 hypothetical protein [Eubacterium sp.]
MNPDILEKINKFTRRPLTEDEVYVFSVILCDNEIDRDSERFSDTALEEICEKFIGKTGISDHNASASNQTARIFDTELITDESRVTKYNTAYKYVKASAYMVKTDENRNLIAEIDGGIKKEVSVSCSAAKRICSVCGCDKSLSSCNHVRGKNYGGKICHTILDNITDAYEWSFVAVPAQINAGVTKHFSSAGAESVPVEAVISDADDELRRDIRKLAYFTGGKAAADTVALTSCGMSTNQLIALKKSLEKQRSRGGIELQLSPETKTGDSNAEYSLR